ncbi:MAG: hypothetical protein U0T81_00365 [Saprospiraceae bacterium]
MNTGAGNLIVLLSNRYFKALALYTTELPCLLIESTSTMAPISTNQEKIDTKPPLLLFHDRNEVSRQIVLCGDGIWKWDLMNLYNLPTSMHFMSWCQIRSVLFCQG